MRVTAANGAEPDAANDNLIAIPRSGPGKRRMVPADSLEGRAVQLANQIAGEVAGLIAPKIVDRCRSIAESMVRERLDGILARLG